MCLTVADILELDSKVNLAYAREAVAGRACLMGNLNPTGLLLQGIPEDVEKAADEAVREAGPSAFILGSGCEVPPDAPRENIQTMIRSARHEPAS